MMYNIGLGGALHQVTLMGVGRNYMTYLRRHAALFCQADTGERMPQILSIFALNGFSGRVEFIFEHLTHISKYCA